MGDTVSLDCDVTVIVAVASRSHRSLLFRSRSSRALNVVRVDGVYPSIGTYLPRLCRRICHGLVLLSRNWHILGIEELHCAPGLSDHTSFVILSELGDSVSRPHAIITKKTRKRDKNHWIGDKKRLKASNEVKYRWKSDKKRTHWESVRRATTVPTHLRSFTHLIVQYFFVDPIITKYKDI